MLTCTRCATQFMRKPGRGRNPKFCGDQCRTAGRREDNRARLRDIQRGRSQPPKSSRVVPCAGVCGGTVWISRSSLPAGLATCRPCRSVLGVAKDPRKVKAAKVACVSCGAAVNAANYWCWPCSVANRIPGKGRDVERRRVHDQRRRDRARLAPGLNQYDRYALLAKWKRQGRLCTYCPSVATSMDHVIPLALGGTNFEGNLTPACAACNSSKNDSLLIEFRRKLELAA